MTTPISRVPPIEVQDVAQAPAPKPVVPAETVKSGTLSSDQVTLKSRGDVDHDGDGG